MKQTLEMSNQEKPAGYDAAFTELKSILDALQQDEIGVDALAEKVKRAADLIAFCGERLRTAEGEVQKVLDELGEGD
jgi:exodeoxyribonuclease VII small subunit